MLAIEKEPVPVDTRMSLYGTVPPVNVMVPALDVEVKAMVELLALNVRFVMVACVHTVALDDVMLQVAFPMLKPLTPLPLFENVRTVTSLLFGVLSSVQPHAPIVMEMRFTVAVAFTVMVPVEFASIVAVSAPPGTLCPPAPPEDADQCAVSVHEPEPPTQNLLAAEA